ncbi:MAG: hypothetical protein LBT00_11500 [Spirochaetaceae bacterium]|nr:hypothetical protein [Spirochaetaceae bacterium]
MAGVIASGAKQSSGDISPPGLLRRFAPRNDEGVGPYSPPRPASGFRVGAWHTVGVRHTRCVSVMRSSVDAWGTPTKPTLALVTMHRMVLSPEGGPRAVSLMTRPRKAPGGLAMTGDRRCE